MEWDKDKDKEWEWENNLLSKSTENNRHPSVKEKPGLHGQVFLFENQ
jgi:hypothetical protein